MSTDENRGDLEERRVGPPDPGPSAPVPEVQRPRKRPRGLRTGLALVVTGAVFLSAAALLDGSQTPRIDRPEPVAMRASTPVLSARRVPTWTTQPLASRALAAAIQPIADAAAPATCIGVGDGSNAHYTHNATMALVPASNMKLLTAAAALDILGADTTLTTRFRATAAPGGGTLTGNLYMIGGGDPVLTTEAYQARRRHGRFPDTDLEAVADRLVATGLRRITGSVIGDASRYDDQRTVAGWPRRWTDGGTVAPLSALVVNDAWLIDPTTGEGPGGTAPDPAAHAAGVMSQLLTERGVAIDGPAASGVAPEATTEVLDVSSMPIADLVHEVLAFSDNTSAELLLKEIGLHDAKEGSTAAGAAAVTRWAAAKHLPVGGMLVADGSGLSSANRVTCDLLAAILRRGTPTGPLATGMAVPGEAGTLDQRFPGPEWTERLRAKTGTLNGVTALSGWLKTRPGATLDFEMITNTGDRAANAQDMALQSRLLTALLDQPKAPPVGEAGPGAPTET